MYSLKKTIKLILNRIRGEQSLSKLKSKGLIIGKNFKQMGGCIIDPSHCWHISIGDDVTFAPRVHVLAHDASTKTHLGYTKVANVSVGNRVFIGAGSIILPGVTIGDDVVIGAGSVVTTSIESSTVYAGVPAKLICSLKEYLDKEKSKMFSENTFSESFTLRKNITDLQKEQLVGACKNFKKIYIE